jgi:hypothetical protein
MHAAPRPDADRSDALSVRANWSRTRGALLRLISDGERSDKKRPRYANPEFPLACPVLAGMFDHP